MPNIKCKCGQLVFRGEIPNPVGFRLFEEKDIDEIVEKIRNLDEYDAYSIFYKYSREVLKCRNCGRVMIDVQNDKHFVTYIKDDNDLEGL